MELTFAFGGSSAGHSKTEPIAGRIALHFRRQWQGSGS
jgi:hypothetical protein